MKLNLSHFLSAITISGMASFATGQEFNVRHRLRADIPTSFNGDETAPIWKSFQLDRAPKTVTYLQNQDFDEEEDPTKFNIDVNLELFTPSTAGAIMSARNKYMKVITGDLPSQPPPFEIMPPCLNDPPAVIDDTYICIKEQEDDGMGGFLGSGSFTAPRIIGEFGNIASYTALSSRIDFDTDDVASLTEDGLFDDFILRLMGHALGFNFGIAQGIYLFGGGPAVVDQDFNYIGEKGLLVWNDEWGCDGSPPVEMFSNFWDEQCFGNEINTRNLDSGDSPLSRLSIAFFDEIGYTVDYEAADDYDGDDTTCCNGASSIQASSEESKPPLSETGRAAATKKGLSILNEMEGPAAGEGSAPVQQDANENFGSNFITVFWEENGNIYQVPVTKE